MLVSLPKRGNVGKGGQRVNCKRKKREVVVFTGTVGGREENKRKNVPLKKKLVEQGLIEYRLKRSDQKQGGRADEGL